MLNAAAGTARRLSGFACGRQRGTDRQANGSRERMRSCGEVARCENPVRGGRRVTSGGVGWCCGWCSKKKETRSSKAGHTFEYVFDLDDEWRHDCTILREDVDPRGEFGEIPKDIIAVWGWGSIPDQHGRTSPDSETDGESEDDG